MMATAFPKGVTKVHHSSHSAKHNRYRKPLVTKARIQEETPSSRIKAYLSQTKTMPIEYRKPKEDDLSSYDVEIVKVIRSKNVDRLREMFLSGRSMNACNQFGESLVHMVCRRGDLKILKFMIDEAKVSFSIKDDFGRNPFHDACWTPEPNMAMMDLLIASADTSLLLSEDVRGNTPFDYVRREHHKAWNDYLEKHREDILKGLNRA
ncbi:unnamed protein product [Cylindrotheca closterium]|uniref:Glutaminase n=1 Tax=Cylindrotheca closterium TaxID=2856 RepID=A0AAD2CDM4_9STRA|nr:unnamed protein product [Cylindrotheca closterium]